MWEEGDSGGIWFHLAPIANHRDGIPSTRTRAESDRGSPGSAHASAHVSQVPSAARPPYRCAPQEAAVKFMNSRQSFAHLFNIVPDTRTALLKHDALFFFLFYCFWDFAIISSWDMKDFF